MTDALFVLKQVFDKNNPLESFQCSVEFPLFTEWIPKFVINFNLHSLTLVLTHFSHIFTLLSYTPNLEYLNVQSETPSQEVKPINKNNIKLKELYLKFINERNWYPCFNEEIYYTSLINVTKMFTSSLTCLSLDFVNVYIRPMVHSQKRYNFFCM
jgi:hypothetical protein